MLKALLIPTILAAGLAAAPSLALDLGGAGGIGGSTGGGIGGSVGGGIGDLRGTAEPLSAIAGTTPLAETPTSSAAGSEPTSLIGVRIVTSDGIAVGNASAVQIGDKGEPVTITVVITDGPREIPVQFPIGLTRLVDGEIHLAASEAQLHAFLASNADTIDAIAVIALHAATRSASLGPASNGVEEAVLAAMRQAPLDESTAGFLQWNEEESLVPAVLGSVDNASRPAPSILDANFTEEAPDFVRPDAAADLTQLFAGADGGNSDRTGAAPAAEPPNMPSVELRAPSTAAPSPAERLSDDREASQAPALTAYPLESSAGYARLLPWLVLPIIAFTIGLTAWRGRDWLASRASALARSPRLSPPVAG
jgi:hypothetical protein